MVNIIHFVVNYIRLAIRIKFPKLLSGQIGGQISGQIQTGL